MGQFRLLDIKHRVMAKPEATMQSQKLLLALKIRYFAILREQAKVSEELIETSAKTASDLYAELCRKHGFTLPQSRLQVAINDQFASWEQDLQDGDRLTFIPPVAGG